MLVLRSRRRTLAALISFGALVGCQAPKGPGAQSDYQTLGNHPQRDTDLARREDEAAIVLLAKGDNAGAEQALRRSLAADVMFGPAHNNLGLVYFRRSQFYLAAWEFQYAIKLMPNQPEARNNLGMVFEAGGKIDQAIDSYSQALKADPDNPHFVGNYVLARVRRGEKGGDIRQLLRQVAANDPRPPWVFWAKERLALMKEPTTETSPK